MPDIGQLSGGAFGSPPKRMAPKGGFVDEDVDEELPTAIVTRDQIESALESSRNRPTPAPKATLAGVGPKLGASDLFNAEESETTDVAKGLRKAALAPAPPSEELPTIPGELSIKDALRMAGRDVPPDSPFEAAPLPSSSEELPAYDDAPEVAPDVDGGESLGKGEDVGEILRMLEREGIFEAPSGEPALWAAKAESRRSGVRIGRALAVIWVVVLVMSVGGYYGWNAWVEHERETATEEAAAAFIVSLKGDHGDLVDAERTVRAARERSPHDSAILETLIFVQAQQALEDGAFDPGFLRPTLARATALEASAPLIQTVTAVLAASEGDMRAASENVKSALESAPGDARVLYIAGRVEQRLGEDTAKDHLESALEVEPNLVAAAIALAELRADEGARDEAITTLGRVLETDAGHLRAGLWRLFLTADSKEPDEGLADLERIREELAAHGAASDKVLAALIRARLSRRKGDKDAAVAAVDQAATAGASEPRLLVLVAIEARAVGRLATAQATASAAVGGAPTNPDFRKLLAEIQLERRDGARALATMAPLSREDPEVLRMLARAALLVGTPGALEGAQQALAAYVESQEEVSVEVRALGIRTGVALGRAAEVLPQARALSREAPGDPLALLALGEAALVARDASAALDALQRLVRASPESAEGHFLLGRARRLSGNADGAEEGFRQAVELSPEHIEAHLSLGRLLLDQGKYEDADELYQRLSQRGGVASGAATALVGRLGRVEALVGMGQLDDATVQLEAVSEEQRSSTVGRIATALLAVAKGEPGAAVQALTPLVQAERATPDVLALLGDAQFDAEETETANGLYDRALAMDRGLPEALVGKARVAVRAERPTDALRYLADAEQVLSRRIRGPWLMARLLTLRGRAYILARKRPEARVALREAVQLRGVAPAAYFYLGESLSRDNAPEARAAYEKYLELEPRGRYRLRAQRAIRANR